MSGVSRGGQWEGWDGRYTGRGAAVCKSSRSRPPVRVKKLKMSPEICMLLRLWDLVQRGVSVWGWDLHVLKLLFHEESDAAFRSKKFEREVGPNAEVSRVDAGKSFGAWENGCTNAQRTSDSSLRCYCPMPKEHAEPIRSKIDAVLAEKHAKNEKIVHFS